MIFLTICWHRFGVIKNVLLSSVLQHIEPCMCRRLGWGKEKLHAASPSAEFSCSYRDFGCCFVGLQLFDSSVLCLCHPPALVHVATSLPRLLLKCFSVPCEFLPALTSSLRFQNQSTVSWVWTRWQGWTRQPLVPPTKQRRACFVQWVSSTRSHSPSSWPHWGTPTPTLCAASSPTTKKE